MSPDLVDRTVEDLDSKDVSTPQVSSSRLDKLPTILTSRRNVKKNLVHALEEVVTSRSSEELGKPLDKSLETEEESIFVLQMTLNEVETSLEPLDYFKVPPFVFSQVDGTEDIVMSLALDIKRKKPSRNIKLPEDSILEGLKWRIKSVDKFSVKPLKEFVRIMYELNTLCSIYVWTLHDVLHIVRRFWVAKAGAPPAIGDIVRDSNDLAVVFKRLFSLLASPNRVELLRDDVKSFAPVVGQSFDQFLDLLWKYYAVLSPMLNETEIVEAAVKRFIRFDLKNNDGRMSNFGLLFREKKEKTFVVALLLYRDLYDSSLVRSPELKKKPAEEPKSKSLDGGKPKGKTKGKKKEERVCDYCHQKNHTMEKCFKRAKDLKKTETTKKQDKNLSKGKEEAAFYVSTPECGICNSFGHLDFECNGGDAFVSECAFVAAMAGVNKDASVHESTERNAVIELWTGKGDPINCIWDNGCTRSIIRADVATRLGFKIEKLTNTRPVESFGQKFDIEHFTHASFAVAPFKETKSIIFLVTQHENAVRAPLLGLDFLGLYRGSSKHAWDPMAESSIHEYFLDGVPLVMGSDFVHRFPLDTSQMSDNANLSVEELEKAESSPDVSQMESHCYVVDDVLPRRWNDGVVRMEAALIASNLPSSFEEKLRKIFGDTILQLGKPNKQVSRPEWELNINLSSDRNLIMPPRRISQYHRRLVEAWLERMLREDRIESSQSKKYLSHLAFPKKPNGDTRICLDPTLLNRFTVPMLFGGMTADDVRTSIPSDAKFFSVIDIKDAFWHLSIARADREKTTFYTHKGLFQFKAMPFGLVDSSRLFNSWILHICADLPFVIPYVDDLVICSRNKEEHIEHLRQIFDKLKQENVRINVDKLQLGCEEVEHLGYILRSGSISCKEETVRAMDAIRLPSSRSDVRSFLGMCRWVERFIPNLSIKLKVFNKLTSEKVKFFWNESLTERFLEVKDMIKNHCAIQIPDFKKPYTIVCDASNAGFGAALLQEGRVCGLYSKAWNDTQDKWPTIEKEAFAIVQSFAHWRDLLLGAEITVETDHRPLVWLADSVSAGGGSRKTHRWFCALLAYKYRLVHRPGRYNELADLLSRSPARIGNGEKLLNPVPGFTPGFAPSASPATTVFVVKDSQKWNLSELSRRYHVWKSIHRSAHATSNEMWVKRMEWSDGHSVTKKDVLEIAKMIHKQCMICQAKDSKPFKTELLTTPVPQWCGEVWGVDLKDVRSLNLKGGTRYVLVLVDHLSKYSILISLRNKKSETVRRSLELFWLLPFQPTHVTFDNGGEFANLDLEEFLIENNVLPHKTTAKHHESNGQVEVFIREVHRSLTHFDFEETNDGPLIVARIAAFHNFRSHAGSGGICPAEFMFGRSRVVLEDKCLEEFRRKRLQQTTKLRLDESQRKLQMKERSDRKNQAVPVPHLEEGTEVFLHDLDVIKSKFKKHERAKVVSQLEDKRVLLELENGSIVNRSIDHISLQPPSTKTESAMIEEDDKYVDFDHVDQDLKKDDPDISCTKEFTSKEGTTAAVVAKAPVQPLKKVKPLKFVDLKPVKPLKIGSHPKVHFDIEKNEVIPIPAHTSRNYDPATSRLPEWIPKRFHPAFNRLMNLSTDSPTRTRRGPNAKSEVLPYLDVLSPINCIVDHKVVQDKGESDGFRLYFKIQWQDSMYADEWSQCRFGNGSALSNSVLKDYIAKF